MPREYTRARPVNKSQVKINAVQASYEAGMPVAQIARLHMVARLTVDRWAALFKWQRPKK